MRYLIIGFIILILLIVAGSWMAGLPLLDVWQGLINLGRGRPEYLFMMFGRG